MTDYSSFDEILSIQIKNELNQYFILLAIGIVLITVTHFGAKYAYARKRKELKLVYKLLICIAALSIVELPSIVWLKYDIQNDNYVCVSARYCWQINSSRDLHHLVIYPDDREPGIELVIPSLDSDADNIDRDRFPQTDEHGTVWYSGKSKYVLCFEPDDTTESSFFRNTGDGSLC